MDAIEHAALYSDGEPSDDSYLYQECLCDAETGAIVQLLRHYHRKATQLLDDLYSAEERQLREKGSQEALQRRDEMIGTLKVGSRGCWSTLPQLPH